MLDSETAERRQQMFGELERERDKLNSEVETLRAFEREYRSRLKSYFTQQLEALSRSRGVAGGLRRAAAGTQAAPLDPRRRRGLSEQAQRRPRRRPTCTLPATQTFAWSITG